MLDSGDQVDEGDAVETGFSSGYRLAPRYSAGLGSTLKTDKPCLFRTPIWDLR